MKKYISNHLYPTRKFQDKCCNKVALKRSLRKLTLVQRALGNGRSTYARDVNQKQQC
jgi:hypothetical protein